MHDVFVRISARELYIRFSDGRIMALESLLENYERLLNTTPEPKSDKSTISKLRVGKWFRIDREIIEKSKEEIRRKCNQVGAKGGKLWKRFEEMNKIADKNPDQYPRLIETYIFEKNWDFKIEQRMRDMCENIGDGMCDEVICNLELQMRICNGESVDDLINKPDKLPNVRLVKLRNGDTGYFGGGVDNNSNNPPAVFCRDNFDPDFKDYNYTPYAFRRVLSLH